MSIVAFTFGSLGDIISLLQIANRVRKALYDTTGASTECRDLLAELDSVVHAVANVQRVLSVEGPSRMPQSIENGLYHAVGVCLNLLAQINERILTWRKSLRDSQTARAVAADIWRRVGWMLFKKEELVILRRSLSEQVAAMNTLLTLAQGNQHDRFQTESRESHTLIREIHRCVTRIPKRSGYPWEGDLDHNNMPVTLDDMLGNTIVLPWELCTTRELFHDFLTFYFRDKPGKVFIRDDEYYLSVTQDQFIHKPRWVVAGSRINMWAIIKAESRFPYPWNNGPLHPYARELTMAELTKSLINILRPIGHAMAECKLALRCIIIERRYDYGPSDRWMTLDPSLRMSVGPSRSYCLHQSNPWPATYSNISILSGGDGDCELWIPELTLKEPPWKRYRSLRRSQPHEIEAVERRPSHIKLDACYLETFVPAHPHGSWARRKGPRVLAEFTFSWGNAPKPEHSNPIFPRCIEIEAAHRSSYEKFWKF